MSVKLGDTVVFVDHHHNEHAGIVTRVHNTDTGTVNLFIAEDSFSAINWVAKFSVPFGAGEAYSWHQVGKE